MVYFLPKIIIGTHISLRVSDELKELLDNLVRITGETKTAIFTMALKKLNGELAAANSVQISNKEKLRREKNLASWMELSKAFEGVDFEKFDRSRKLFRKSFVMPNRV